MTFRGFALRGPDERVISHTVVDNDYQVHELVGRWLHDVRFGRDCSLNTTRKYAADLAHYLSWAMRAGYTIEKAPAHMADYLFLLRTETLPPGQRGAGRARRPQRTNDMLVAVRSFYDWAIDSQHLSQHVEQQLWRRRGRHREAKHRFRETTVENREVLSEEDVLALIKAAGNVRDQLMIVLLRYTGARIGQILGLRLEDVHLSEDNSRYPAPEGKGAGCAVAGPHIHRIRREDNPNGATSKARHHDYVPVPFIVVELCLSYLPWRDRIPDADRTAMLLLNHSGSALGMSYPNNLLRRLTVKAGVRHCTPHMFRHTFATNLRRDGAELDTIRRLLGQLSPRSVEIYNHAPSQAMREAVESMSPPQNGS